MGSPARGVRPGGGWCPGQVSSSQGAPCKYILYKWEGETNPTWELDLTCQGDDFPVFEVWTKMYFVQRVLRINVQRVRINVQRVLRINGGKHEDGWRWWTVFSDESECEFCIFGWEPAKEMFSRFFQVKRQSWGCLLEEVFRACSFQRRTNKSEFCSPGGEQPVRRWRSSFWNGWRFFWKLWLLAGASSQWGPTKEMKIRFLEWTKIFFWKLWLPAGGWNIQLPATNKWAESEFERCQKMSAIVIIEYRWTNGSDCEDFILIDGLIEDGCTADKKWLMKRRRNSFRDLNMNNVVFTSVPQIRVSYMWYMCAIHVCHKCVSYMCVIHSA